MTQSRINIRLTPSPAHLPLRTRKVTSLKKWRSWVPTFSLHNTMLLLLAEPICQGLQLIPFSFGSFLWTEIICLRLWRFSRPCVSAKAEASFTEAVDDAGRRPAELQEPVSQTYCRLSSEHRITVFMGCQLSWGGFLGNATTFESSLLSNSSSLLLWVTPRLHFKSWVQSVHLVAVFILVCGGFPFWSRYVCAVSSQEKPVTQRQ